MDHTIELVRTMGRAPIEPSFQIGEPLTLDELGLLSEEKGSKPIPLKTLRDTHHLLAQMLARGASLAEASLATGYSPARCSILKADPAFAELLSMYRQEVREEFSDLTRKLKTLGSSIVDELIERLEAEPEKLSVNQLSDLAKMTLDRSGFGPQSKSTNVNVNVDLAGRLEAARRRAAIGTEPGKPVLIEGMMAPLSEESDT